MKEVLLGVFVDCRVTISSLLAMTELGVYELRNSNKMQDHKVWLPYTQMKNHLPQLDVESALGSKIFLKDGRVLIDGVASWWSAAHGYSHPHIVEALVAQSKKLPHMMLAGFKNDATYELAERLTAMTDLHSCLFVDSGSVAVEAAMKIAWQYFENLGINGKKKFVSFKDSYHGDTTGAMSLADLEGSMHARYKGTLIDNFSVDLPQNDNGFDKFEDFLKQNSREIAAIFIEPIVRCAGGMKFAEPEIYAKIDGLAKKYGVLLIADECAVGFYRLGQDFASNICGVKPDILLLGKALTGGVTTLAAALVTEEIFESFLGDDLSKALMHGPTFMGNALASSASNASLDLFEREDYAAKVSKIEGKFESDLADLGAHDRVKEVRVKGALAAIETDFAQKDMFDLRRKFIEKGVSLRPFSNVIYSMPALTVAEDELDEINAAIREVLGEY